MRAPITGRHRLFRTWMRCLMGSYDPWRLFRDPDDPELDDERDIDAEIDRIREERAFGET